MTTEQGPTEGPLIPKKPGPAGLSLGPEWHWFPRTSGITCLGTRTDRRTDPRGPDRRLQAREGPCRSSWGHVGPGSPGAWVRIAKTSNAPAPWPTLFLRCKRCTVTLEFLVLHAAEAA
jgi:hypothetical protein